MIDIAGEMLYLPLKLKSAPRIIATQEQGGAS